MGYFLTGKSRIEQTEVPGYWKLLDNELYMDNKGTIKICPRYFWTDGYTFPLFLQWLTGDKNYQDVRPAHQHDLQCRFHEEIIVDLSLGQLRRLGYLHQHNNIIVCEDIPKMYLHTRKVTKFKANNNLKEMMLSLGIDKYYCNMIRLGVIFNFNWFRTGKVNIKNYNIFKEDIPPIYKF